MLVKREREIERERSIMSSIDVNFETMHTAWKICKYLYALLSRKRASFFAQSCHFSRSHSSEMKHCRRDTPALVSKLALFQVLSRRYFLELFCIHWTSHLHLNWRILVDRWMKFCRRYFIKQYAKHIIRRESLVCDYNCKKTFNKNTDKLSILLNYYKLLFY